MCRLFGMSGGTREVQATFWLLDAPSSLLLQSENQPDGVGLGTFKADGTPTVYRKPVAANRSETFITGALNVRSATFLSHIRHATEAEPSLRNTHPFEQHGRLLAHNGIVGDVPELRRRLGDYVELVHGETDSEHYFALITKRIDEHGDDVAAGIGAAAREIAADLSLYSLNIVVTTPSRALGSALPGYERALDPRAVARHRSGHHRPHRLRRDAHRPRRRVRRAQLRGNARSVRASSRFSRRP